MNQASLQQPDLLSVEAVTVRFAGVTALADVSFAVRPGELFAIIGPNGAEKLHCLMCFHASTNRRLDG